MLGEGFTPEDEEDSAAAEVSKVWAYQARYRVVLAKVTAGTYLLLCTCFYPVLLGQTLYVTFASPQTCWFQVVFKHSTANNCTSHVIYFPGVLSPGNMYNMVSVILRCPAELCTCILFLAL